MLKLCLTQTLQYAMSVRFAHIINFPKVAATYFAFLEVAFRQHLDLLVDLCDTPKFLAVVSSLHEGLLSLHVTQVVEASKAIDSLMTWHFQRQQTKYASQSTQRTTDKISPRWALGRCGGRVAHRLFAAALPLPLLLSL